jgi:hypothetical protein
VYTIEERYRKSKDIPFKDWEEPIYTNYEWFVQRKEFIGLNKGDAMVIRTPIAEWRITNIGGAA